jgi:predicted translin family RNA/ssDNA-binding protein
VAKLLAVVAPDIQGSNRYRYLRNLSCLEELAEAVSFAFYLQHQKLLGFDEMNATLERMCGRGSEAFADETGTKDGQPPAALEQEEPATKPMVVALTPMDYLCGIFDLTGEMMRFATTTSALNGELAHAAGNERNVVKDMQDLGSFFEMLPQSYDKSWKQKMTTLQASVKKVEKLGYGLKVRGSERPKGYVPDMADSEPESP